MELFSIGKPQTFQKKLLLSFPVDLVAKESLVFLKSQDLAAVVCGRWSAFPLGTLSWAFRPGHKDVFWTQIAPSPQVEPGNLYFKDSFKRSFTLEVQIRVVCGSPDCVWGFRFRHMTFSNL